METIIKKRFDSYMEQICEVKDLPKWQYYEMRQLFYCGFIACFNWASGELRKISDDELDVEMAKYKWEVRDFCIESISRKEQQNAARRDRNND